MIGIKDDIGKFISYYQDKYEVETGIAVKTSYVKTRYVKTSCVKTSWACE